MMIKTKSVTILFLFLLSACSQQPDRPPATLAELDRVTTAKTPLEIARYIFDNYGCENCHTISSAGKFGFTASGEQLKNKSEGCIALLTAIHQIAVLTEANRTNEHQQKLALFDEYGCSACHRVSYGTVGLTEVGEALRTLHMGCVDVQQILN
jgi:cytochrome c551/c552